MRGDFIDAGGSAKVYRCSGPDGQDAVIKILDTRRPESERYQRFLDEVTALGELQDIPGLVRMFDASTHYAEWNGSPWLVMEALKPARTQLGSRPDVTEVLEASAAFARTLLDVHKRGYSHRDIKPGNLFFGRGSWIVGDLGLIDFPDKRDITREGAKLGPSNFVAPEMIDAPESAHGAPADVFSLGKTVWVLVTGQNWPPQGELRVDREAAALGQFLVDGREPFLSSLLERMTLDSPGDRPTMEVVVNELTDIIDPPTTELGTVTVDHVVSRIVTSGERARRAKEREEMLMEQARQLAREVAPYTGHIHDVVSAGGMEAQSNRGDIELINVAISMTSPQKNRIEQECTGLWASAPRHPINLHSGVAIIVFSDGTAHLVAAHLVRGPGVATDLVLNDSEVTLGSIGASIAIKRLGQELVDAFPVALEHYEQAAQDWPYGLT